MMNCLLKYFGPKEASIWKSLQTRRLRNQGHDISPYLIGQMLKNFVEIKERVYPLLVKTRIVAYAGDKEIHLTKRSLC